MINYFYDKIDSKKFNKMILKNVSIVIAFCAIILFSFFYLYNSKTQQDKMNLFNFNKKEHLKTEQDKTNFLNFNKEEYFKDLTKRTESFPFVTGDTFRIISDYVLDQVTTSIPESSFHKPKPIIFVKTDYISKFFQEYFPKFLHKIILITHNSDYPITKRFMMFIEMTN